MKEGNNSVGVVSLQKYVIRQIFIAKYWIVLSRALLIGEKLMHFGLLFILFVVLEFVII